MLRKMVESSVQDQFGISFQNEIMQQLVQLQFKHVNIPIQLFNKSHKSYCLSPSFSLDIVIAQALFTSVLCVWLM